MSNNFGDWRRRKLSCCKAERGVTGQKCGTFCLSVPTQVPRRAGVGTPTSCNIGEKWGTRCGADGSESKARNPSNGSQNPHPLAKDARRLGQPHHLLFMLPSWEQNVSAVVSRASPANSRGGMERGAASQGPKPQA